jgi:uncharacterized protein
MSRPRIVIGEEKVTPGHRKTIFYPMPKLYDCTPMYLPIHVLCGHKKGPTLLITSTIHGDEINGVEIIRRLLKKKGLKDLVGNIIAIPIVNIYGFLYQKRYLVDRRDLNRSFPGKASGSLSSRLAEIISNEILPLATHVIDLHTGSNCHFNLPQIRTNLDMPENKELAESFNVPVVLHSAYRDGSLREHANEQGIPFLVYEAGEALRFDELSIRTGINGILSVMASLKMIQPSRFNVKKFISVTSRDSYWVRAPIGGILKPAKKCGNRVTEGQILAIIANPTGDEEYKLKSPISGIIIGDNKVPLIHEGQALFHIASFEKLNLVEKQLDNIQESFDLSDDDLIF